MLYRSTRRSRGGFTLIEMMVVVAVLAAVASLVVARLGFVETQAGNATAAGASAQLVSNLEAYRTSTGSYPLGLDSLVDDTGSLYSALWEHVGPSFGPKHYLEIVDAAPYAQSIGHAFGVNSAGERYVYDHLSTSTDPNNSATIKRNLTFTGTTNLAFVKAYAPGPPPAPMLLGWYKAAGYPDGTLPTGTRLIAFGIGPNTGSVGETMASTPTHIEQNTDTYGRYIAIFAVYSSGKAAQLKTIVDSQGVSVSGNVASYRLEGAEHE